MNTFGKLQILFERYKSLYFIKITAHSPLENMRVAGVKRCASSNWSPSAKIESKNYKLARSTVEKIFIGKLGNSRKKVVLGGGASGLYLKSYIAA